MFLDHTASREDLLSAIYGDLDLVQHFIDLDLDPESMGTEDVRDTVIEWVEAGDECAAA